MKFIMKFNGTRIFFIRQQVLKSNPNSCAVSPILKMVLRSDLVRVVYIHALTTESSVYHSSSISDVGWVFLKGDQQLQMHDSV